MPTVRQYAVVFVISLGFSTALMMQLPWFELGMLPDAFGLLWGIDMFKILFVFAAVVIGLMLYWNQEV